VEGRGVAKREKEKVLLILLNHVMGRDVGPQTSSTKTSHALPGKKANGGSPDYQTGMHGDQRELCGRTYPKGGGGGDRR